MAFPIIPIILGVGAVGALAIFASKVGGCTYVRTADELASWARANQGKAPAKLAVVIYGDEGFALNVCELVPGGVTAVAIAKSAMNEAIQKGMVLDLIGDTEMNMGGPEVVIAATNRPKVSMFIATSPPDDYGTVARKLVKYLSTGEGGVSLTEPASEGPGAGAMGYTLAEAVLDANKGTMG